MLFILLNLQIDILKLIIKHSIWYLSINYIYLIIFQLLLIQYYLLKKYSIFIIKYLSLIFIIYLFTIIILMYNNLNNLSLNYYYFFKLSYLLGLNFNFEYSIGIDNFSYVSIFLTTMLFPLCLLINWTSLSYQIKYYYFMFILLEFILINVFCASNLLIFYIYFESLLIPMFLLIGIWGSRYRKIFAAYQFFIYTLIGSLFILMSLIFLLINFGNTDLIYLMTINLSPFRELFIWSLLFLGLL